LVYELTEIDSGSGSFVAVVRCRITIEGESAGLFKAEKVVDILRTFETPESRLAALKQLIGVDDRAARRVYGKIEGSCRFQLTEIDSWRDITFPSKNLENCYSIDASRLRG
jgi:hypothetical protein